MTFLLRIPILNWKRSPLRKPGPEYFVTLQTISSLPLIPQQLNAQRISLHPVELSKTNGNGRIQIRFFSRHVQLVTVRTLLFGCVHKLGHWDKILVTSKLLIIP
ncbi:hypothetical protein OIU74_029549 [Salix koriyanagi]|uniref:Uncharacterized protein n=1 Tax=Salix koriyanagi TaxID=2511006 RepID=A0A9Q0ZUF9_9ROSI|nr:hypothetical protein OIU74_029549 [Salix koriyanagi]